MPQLMEDRRQPWMAGGLFAVSAACRLLPAPPPPLPWRQAIGLEKMRANTEDRVSTATGSAGTRAAGEDRDCDDRQS